MKGRNDNVRGSKKVKKKDDKGKSDSRALLFNPLISHSHKELWGRFILFTFLLHLFSVILQRGVSYTAEGRLPGEESAPFTAL